jgi:hypothetical protein
LALVTVVAGLLPATAGAEVIAPGGDTPVMAVSAAGTPTVAYLDGRALVVTTRTPSGWTPSRVALPVPATEADVVTVAVGRDGRPAVLVEDLVRRTLVVAWRRPSRWLVVRAARLSARVQLGIGGLALARSGEPLVAYAFREPSKKTYLRLVRIDAHGRATTIGITKLGFPGSALPPSAVPHISSSGAVRVVEAYTSAVIDWFRTGRTWTGQYLFESARGTPLGRILAVPVRGTTVVAWTQDYPEFGETHVVLQEGRPTGDVQILLTHATLAALTVADGVPEVAANDWVDVDGSTVFAGMLAFLDAPPVELDGYVAGYAAVGATRQLLLETDRGLEWFSAPRPSIRVSFAVDGTGAATGRVDGTTGGSVQIFRDAPDTGRLLVATVPVAADGSFSARVPASPTLYRAVYRDPSTGIPYAALLRSPVVPG